MIDGPALIKSAQSSRPMTTVTVTISSNQDAILAPGAEVQLEGTAESVRLTGAGDPITTQLRFTWSLSFQAPGGSPTDATALLQGAQSLTPTFIARNPGTYRVSLVAGGRTAVKTFTAIAGSVGDAVAANAAIVAKARALGFAFTGSVLSSLEGVPGGYRIRYAKCDIYYSTATGAHEVHGDIRAKYNAKGGPASDLGLPLTDELTTPDRIGRYNHFAGNGSIYWTPTTGPMEVRGGIRGTWANQGWERGPLGYPTSDEQVVGPQQWYSDFQNGVIYWQGNQTVPTANVRLTSAQLLSWARKFFSDHNPSTRLKLESVRIGGVTHTGYDFWHSSDRLVTIHFEGEIDSGHWYIPNWGIEIDLRLKFYANKRSDGNTELLYALDGLRVEASNKWLLGAGTGDIEKAISDGITGFFKNPQLLTTVPGTLTVLSFKVMLDGGLTLFLKPDDQANKWAPVIQQALDGLYKT
jgi:hypothetical protein